MAVGDQDDMQSRLQAVLPRSWFPDVTSVLSGVTAGLAAAWSAVWDLLVYVRLQTRIATATEGNLDLIASDFLGPAFTRQPGETDDAFRARIRRAILQPTATRAAVVLALQNLTGNTPSIVEPRRAADTGGYGSSTVAGQGGGVGYDAAGAYGSMRLPFQAFLTVQRPIAPGVPLVGGYGVGFGYASLSQPALATGPGEYVSLDQLRGVKDQDIYDSIAATTSAASVVWTRIVDPSPVPGDQLDVDFYLDRSVLG